MKGGPSCGVHTLPLKLGLVGNGNNVHAEILSLEVKGIDTHPCEAFLQGRIKAISADEEGTCHA